jgi:hypothetical protein
MHRVAASTASVASFSRHWLISAFMVRLHLQVGSLAVLQ